MKVALPSITKPYITMLEDIGLLGLHNREENVIFRKTEQTSKVGTVWPHTQTASQSAKQQCP